MEMETRVSGISKHQGEVEGKRYNYVKVYMEMDLSMDATLCAGKGGVIIRIKDGDRYDEFKGLKYPGNHIVTLNMEADGNGSFKQFCTNIRPIPSASTSKTKTV